MHFRLTVIALLENTNFVKLIFLNAYSRKKIKDLQSVHNCFVFYFNYSLKTTWKFLIELIEWMTQSKKSYRE